ncbi:MAG TPA: pyridoxal 5'-phosphate synthase glutaminase subunit PdxT [Acidimicrobiales bacterium]|nr:pyridoxal 5'-phosphate synthase glutaminase subunit PdxT [Acidimicrobiales bacterium]
MGSERPRGRRRVGVLAVQGDVAEHVAVIEQLGAEAVAVKGSSDVGGLDALVLPGGESTTISLLLASSGLDREIAAMVADGLPMLGTCAGMILLASEILDGRPDQRGFSAIDLAVRRNGFGRQVKSFETDLDVKGLDAPMHAVFIRAPLVERVGAATEVLAEVELPGTGGERRPVVCRQGNVIVSSFHPELSGDSRLHAELLASTEGD